MKILKRILLLQIGEKTEKKLLLSVAGIFLCIVLAAVSFFAYDILHGKRADQIDFTCEEITGFEWVKDGGRIPVTLPCDLDTEKGGEVILEAGLPDIINDDTWIHYVSAVDSRILVNGELRKSFERDSDTIAGGAVKSLHMFIELYPEDAGGTLGIVRDGDSDNGSDIRAVYIGTSLGLIERIIVSNIVYFFLAVTLLVISFMCILIGLLLWYSRKLSSPITAIGVGVLFVSMWLIFDSELYQFAFRNYYIDGTMSFIMMLLIPYPFLYYMDMLQEHRYRGCFAFLALYLEIVSIGSALVHFAGIVDFLTMLPFLALAEGVVIAGGIASMILDYLSGAYKSYWISFVGMAGFIASCIAELILIQTVEDRYDGTMIIAGLYWILILAIIHQLYAVREARQETAMAIRASETKSNFLANISHEIRTPMNAILGMDEMILREARGNEKITKYASDIRSAGNILLAIINDVLDLSKIESGKAELIYVDFDVCSVINDLINITRKRAADKGLSYSFDAASGIPRRMNADEIRVRQIMLNIINNAVKYTEKGSVTVELGMKSYGMEEIQNRDSVTIVVSVKDTGIGIKEEDLDNLFQPFDRLEQTKNRNIEGTGLGLNIANKYIQMMGGRIEVSSVYGEGSLFTAYIPLSVVDATPIGDFTDVIRSRREEPDEYRTEIIAPNARALVIDDNEMNLEVISGLMESTQIRVDTALSGPEGMERMEKVRYDIVFLDQMMPGMDGVTTLSHMRSRFDMRGVSVIALTADAVVGAREFYLEKGFDDYLSKPVKSETLEKMLIRHLPPSMLLTPEDIARISEAEERRRLDKEQLKSVVVIDPDSESLKDAKMRLNGAFKGTYVKDTEKAGKYLDRHDADYVMLSRKLYNELTSE